MVSFKSCGPAFGGGEGNDLNLSSKKFPDSPNYSCLGGTYSLPEGISYKSIAAKSYLAGSYAFGVEEYEVFGFLNKEKFKL